MLNNAKCHKNAHQTETILNFNLILQNRRIKSKNIDKNEKKVKILMLLEIIYSFPNISTSVEYDCVETKQEKLLKMFRRIKTKVLEIHNERLKKVKEFDRKFEKLISEYFVQPYEAWIFPAEDIDLFMSTEPKKNSHTLKFFSIQKIMRKLFFSDFIAFFYEFSTKINTMILVENGRGRCFNYQTLTEVFEELDSSQQFAEKNEVNMGFLETVALKDISFIYLLERLEKMIRKRTGNSRDMIRKCLFMNPGFSFDVSENKNIQDFFHVISHFLTYYSPRFSIKEEEVFCYNMSRVICYRLLDVREVLKLLIKYYQEYLRINICLEYETCSEPLIDPRFIEYRKCKNDLLSCCIKKGDNENIINVSCEKHQKDINKIRKNYGESILLDFYEENSFFDKEIVFRLEEIYYSEYYSRMSADDSF
ncbi:hypothetical protein CDIK_2451 [Cucumispora dikerogammari]|nr:hypothetical protein CDIK_2451 [Cucumispora dikerogammari]